MSIDLSSAAGSVSLFNSTHIWGTFSNSTLLLNEQEIPERLHCERLICELDSLLKSHRLSVGDVSEWLTSSGPGSFTGLRIAMATLKGIGACISSARLATMDSSEARAITFFRSQTEAKCLPIDVLTTLSHHHSTVKRFQISRENESIVSLPLDRFDTENSILISDIPNRGIFYPPRSRYLGLASAFASSYKRYEKFEDWATLVPEYGSSPYLYEIARSDRSFNKPIAPIRSPVHEAYDLCISKNVCGEFFS